MMVCHSCGATVPAGARFCPTCGAPQAGGPQAEERRIVTVLFADLVGFTALAEHLDPEQVKRLVDRCFERMVEVVAEFGGRVDKILGDGMLVLFGAPVAHEDDPERAVRAALRMQDGIGRLVTDLGRDRVGQIRMRIGINTGEVLVGTLAGTDYTAMGDVVNLASRLQSLAPAGGILVGEATHGLTVHSFDYEPFGELQPRGREQSLHAWLAKAATAPPGTRRRRRRDVCFVGRFNELTITDAAVDLVLEHRRGLALHVNGENGVGKSRLVDEVISRLRDRGSVTVLEGACVPYGESNVWWPLANALSTYLDLDTGLPLDDVRAAARGRTSVMFPDHSDVEREQLVDVFAHLLGYPSGIDRLDPASARSTIHQSVAQVLQAKAHDGPIVLSIDDLHWADPVLLELLSSLVLSLGRQPFVLITAMRPGHDVVWPPHTDRSTVLALTLQPLSRTEADALSVELLGEHEADEPRLEELYDRSGGNPLFLIELVALTATGSEGELPDSLRTLIAARLDQLTTAERQVLENAAVLGTSGNMVALERFAEALGQPDPTAIVHELDELGLLEVRGRRWEFRSESVRDAAYQTLTKAARAQRHAGVAKAMVGTSLGVDDLAHHVASAAELQQELGRVEGLPDDLTERALAVLTTAADRALDGGSLRLAVRHATRALGLLRDGADPKQLAHLRKVRAAAQIDRRRFEAASTDIDALAELAELLDDVSLDAEAHRLRGMLANVAGRPEEARAELGMAIDLLRQLDLPHLLASALRSRGFIEMFTGSLADAEWFFGEADELFRSLGDERGMAYIEQHRAWISFLSGDLVLARERLNHAAGMHTTFGDRNGVGWAYGLLAFIEFFERRFDEAENLAVTVSREADLRGDEWAAGMMDTLRADLRLWQGRLEEAHDLADKARTRFKRLNDRFGLVQAMAPLSRSQIALGRFAASQRTAEELSAIADTGTLGAFPLMALAGSAMHRGNGVIAASMAERAIDAMDDQAGLPLEPMVVKAVALVQLDQVDHALIAIESVLDDAGDHPFTRAAAALVYMAAGRAEQALENAQSVAHTEGATYLDEVFAYVGAAGAHAQLGDTAHAELSAQAAVARAIGTGDVVATALATATYRAVTGRAHPAYDDRTQLGEGWERVVNLLERQLR